MHDRSLSWFGTGTSGKNGGFKLSNVIKFVYLQIQCTLPLTFMTWDRHFKKSGGG